MKQSSANQRGRQAFTLIELLVVIAIIGILAAMILPAITGVKQSAKKTMAKTEITALMAAINQYQVDYSRLPASQSAINAAANSPCHDYTFGTLRANGQDGFTGPLGGAVVGTLGYQNCNAEIMDILLGSANYPNGTANPLANLNPRNSSYFEAKFVNSTNLAGISLIDHVDRDPWGNPYIITLDLNYDDRCVDTVYGGIMGYTNSGSVMIWSFGPDGNFSTVPGTMNSISNKDNIVSWK